MCLSDVYTIAGTAEPLQVARKVSNIKVEGSQVVIVDFMGDETILEGSIEDVDLLSNKILVRVTE